MVFRSCSCKTTPHHHPSTAVFDSGFEMLLGFLQTWFRTWRPENFGLICSRSLLVGSHPVLCSDVLFWDFGQNFNTEVAQWGQSSLRCRSSHASKQTHRVHFAGMSTPEKTRTSPEGFPSKPFKAVSGWCIMMLNYFCSLFGLFSKIIA